MPDITQKFLQESEPYSPSAIEQLMDYERETLYLRSPDLESYWTKNEINTNLLASDFSRDLFFFNAIANFLNPPSPILPLVIIIKPSLLRIGLGAETYI